MCMWDGAYAIVQKRQSGMLKKARAQTTVGVKQKQHIHWQAKLHRCVGHGFDGWRWESERAQGVWVGTVGMYRKV
jgi:hypothetical protein